jgi:hypothetical protein
MNLRCQTEISVCMWWSLLFLICRRKDKSLAGVFLPDSHMTRTRGIMVKTPFQQVCPSPTTPDSIKQDYPSYIIQGMMARSNPLPITRRHHGSKDQVHSVSTRILTTTSNRSTRRSPVTSKEDACPSLHEASMTIRWASMVHTWAIIIIHLPWAMSSRWTSLVSTPGLPQLKRASKNPQYSPSTCPMAGTYDRDPCRHSITSATRTEQLGLIVRWPEHRPSTATSVSTTSTPSLGEDPLYSR